MQQDKVNLLGLNQKAIEDFFISIGKKNFMQDKFLSGFIKKVLLTLML